MRFVGFITLLTFCGLPVQAAEVAVSLVSPALVQQRLLAGEVDAGKRHGVVQKLFQDAGCGPDDLILASKIPNVICTLRGETESTIIVGAHYDFSLAGDGIVDDWTGTALLPSLFEALKSHPRRHTYIFVAFADEERGLLGSSRFVKSLTPGQIRSVQGFINLECLGLGGSKVWLRRADATLARELQALAQSLGIKLEGVNVDAVGDDDSHSFLRAHIRVITIHSMTQATLHIIHSRADNTKAVDSGVYYDSYRLTTAYLAWLDQAVPVLDGVHQE